MTRSDLHMSPERIAVEDAGDGLAILRLVRSGERNAIDLEMASSLDAAARAVEAISSLRALLICADGPSFCVGGDLPEILAAESTAAQLDAMLTPHHDALERLASLPVPVVCAVQGAVAGGGLGLLWAADLVLAADDARLIGAFGALGLSNDSGSSWWLPRLVGLRRAQQLMLGGRELDAATALEWGLFTELVAPAGLQDAALAAARALASGPTVALGAQRRLLRESFDRPLSEQLAEEKRTIETVARTDDAGEGIQAFAERRPARFTGR